MVFTDILFLARDRSVRILLLMEHSATSTFLLPHSLDVRRGNKRWLVVDIDWSSNLCRPHFVVLFQFVVLVGRNRGLDGYIRPYWNTTVVIGLRKFKTVGSRLAWLSFGLC